jgi:hypothetical protein
MKPDRLTNYEHISVDINQLRVGIAGSGFAGKFHLKNFAGSGATVTAVTSAREESRTAFAARHGLRAFASVEEMLPAVDVLDICTLRGRTPSTFLRPPRRASTSSSRSP